jgi:hypothetical protein
MADESKMTWANWKWFVKELSLMVGLSAFLMIGCWRLGVYVQAHPEMKDSVKEWLWVGCTATWALMALAMGYKYLAEHRKGLHLKEEIWKLKAKLASAEHRAQEQNKS